MDRPPLQAPHVGSRPGDGAELKHAAWLIAPGCQAVFNAIESGGFVARAVGGSVRNTLMGLAVADVDIATPALPEDVMRLVGAAGLGVHPTGLSHGTITVVSDHVAYEVTTLRLDVETHGRHATIAFTEDWAEDAARRDFTMNALYCDKDGQLFDPLGGLEDLRSRTVRFIGNPTDRIREDYLRILRFFRFFAAYGHGEIDATGLAAVTRERDGLTTLSAERIRVELLKLLCAPGVIASLTYMEACGILALVVGGPSRIALVARLADIECEMALAPDGIVRLAALAAGSEQQARFLAARLKLSNQERKQLVNAALGLERPVDCELKSQKELLYRLGVEAYRTRCLIGWAADQSSKNEDAWKEAFGLPDRWAAPPLPFKGSDLIERGVEAGPRVGAILKQFESWWIASGFPVEQELLNEKLNRLIDA